MASCFICEEFPSEKEKKIAENARDNAKKCVNNLITRIYKKDASLNPILDKFLGTTVNSPEIVEVADNLCNILDTLNNPLCFDKDGESIAEVKALGGFYHCGKIYIHPDFFGVDSNLQAGAVIHEAGHEGLSSFFFWAHGRYDKPDEFYINEDGSLRGATSYKQIEEIPAHIRRKLPDAYRMAVMKECDCNTPQIS